MSTESLHTLSRPTRVRFHDTSRVKIGRQVFCNRVGDVTKKLKFNWHFTPFSSDSIRIQLKESLVKYPSNSSSNKDTAYFLSSRLEHPGQKMSGTRNKSNVMKKPMIPKDRTVQIKPRLVTCEFLLYLLY